MNSRYSLVMGLLLTDCSIQPGNGPVGSRTVVYSLMMGLLVADQ